VFFANSVACELVTNASFPTAQNSGNRSYAVPFVVEGLDFVSFVLGEMCVVLLSYQSRPFP
jgi:hypothetical protein